jgi:hypothetical protein
MWARRAFDSCVRGRFSISRTRCSTITLLLGCLDPNGAHGRRGSVLPCLTNRVGHRQVRVQVYGNDAVGAVVVRRKLARGRVLAFFEALPRAGSA